MHANNIQLLAAFKLLQSAAESRDQTTTHSNNIQLLAAFKLLQAAEESRDQTTTHANNIKLLAAFKLLQAAESRDQTTIHSAISYYVGSTKHNRELGFNTIMLQETSSKNKRPAAETRVQTTSSRNNTIMLQETCLINIKKKPQETRLQAASIKKIMNLTIGPLLG